jgi:hypothetical protein
MCRNENADSLIPRRVNITTITTALQLPFSSYPRASCNLTCTPDAEQLVRVRLCFGAGSGSRFSIRSNRWMRRTVTYDASVRANCSVLMVSALTVRSDGRSGASMATRREGYIRPRQILGPPLNGKYSHPTFLPTHRSGLNSSASSPQRSLRRCMTCTE